MVGTLEKRAFLLAGVMGTDNYFVDAFVDVDFSRVYIDETNLIKAIEALLNVMPQVVDNEQAVWAALAFIESPIVNGLRDVTEANAGFSNWMQGLVNEDGSIG